MSQQYPGGFIQKTPPTVSYSGNQGGGTAPGIWTLEQAGYYKNNGVWPIPFISGAWSWGYNNSGQLGLNNTNPYRITKQIGQLATWSYFAAGTDGVMALQNNNTLWAWGANGSGQLGQNNRVAASSPVQIGALTNWSKVAIGANRGVCSVKTDNTLWAWGTNGNGQLGLGNTAPRSSPVQVGSLTDWSDVAAGYADTIFLKTNGTLWACGRNGEGMLGQNNTAAKSSPVQIGSLTDWSKIACGNNHVLSIKTNGSLWSWGANGNGQLGQNNITYRSSPVQIGALTTWAKAGAGFNHSLAIKTDGTLWSWGANNNGQLGQNDVVYRSSPVQVGVLTTWGSCYGATWGDASAAIKTDGTLWMWGVNNNGQLGQNNTVYKSSPVQVGASAAWVSAALGQAFSSGITNT